MKKSIISIITLFIIFNVSAQLKTTSSNTLEDRVKNESNKTEVIELLEILRADLYTNFKQEFVFVVKDVSFKKNYSWFVGDVQEKMLKILGCLIIIQLVVR